MGIKKIVFSNLMDELWRSHIDMLREKYPDINIIEGKPSKTVIADTDIIIAGKVDSDIITETKRLKHYIVPWTGVNFIPFELLAKKGIRLYNAHGNTQLVAERVLGMLLALLGRVCEFDRDLRKNIWHRSGSSEEDWETLFYKKIGFVGAGAIASNCEKLLQPFQCRIYHLRRKPQNDSDVKTLEELTGRSDIIIVAVPLTPETKGMINTDNMDVFKGKYLINVSRGDVIEEDALFRLLDKNIIKGAAIDTWYNYPTGEVSITPPSEKHDFSQFRNRLIMSPHCAMHTKLGHIRDIEGTMENIIAIISEQFHKASEINLNRRY